MDHFDYVKNKSTILLKGAVLLLLIYNRFFITVASKSIPARMETVSIFLMMTCLTWLIPLKPNLVCELNVYMIMIIAIVLGWALTVFLSMHQCLQMGIGKLLPVLCEQLVSPTPNAVLLLFGEGETNCLQGMSPGATWQNTGDGVGVTRDGLMSRIYSCELECKAGWLDTS